MSGARDEIFGRLKAVLDKRGQPNVRFAAADERMRSSNAGLIPKRGQTHGAIRMTTFVDEAQRAGAQVVHVRILADVPTVVAGILQDVGASRLKIAPHAIFQAMDWSDINVEFGIGHGDDKAGLSLAYAGVAETGTLVLCSGAQTPTTLNFLPDTHLVVLRATQIEANYEAVWTSLRADASDEKKSAKAKLPRTINWITGPSRTADIEQTILMGAHGPRKLVILLIDENAKNQT